MLKKSSSILIDDKLEAFFMKCDYQMINEWKKWMTFLKKYAERDWLNLLNYIYWKNFKQSSNPIQWVIDWEDIEKNIWIQVTIETEKSKFRDDTINKFPPKWKEYLKKLEFLVLTYNSRWNVFKSWNDLNCDFFTCTEDIYTLFRLHKDIMQLADIEKIFDIIKILNSMYPGEFSELISYIKDIEISNNNLDEIKKSVLEFKNISL